MTAGRTDGDPPTDRTDGRTGIHASESIGERIADRTVGAMGSWPFIIVQTTIVLLWVTVNILAIALRFDPYPFILLNLAFSTQAAYAAPLILMAGNRAAARDRRRDDLEAQEVDELLTLNHRQLEILTILHQIKDQA